MAKTSTQINLKLYDLTAQTDAEYTAADKQTFVDIADLNNDFDAPVNYATLEPDQWRLDGTMDLFPDDMTTLQYGLWSLSRSNGSNVISVELDIDFDSVHSSIGLSFEFYPQEYATEVYVEWYDALDALITSGTYTNDKTDMFVDESVVDYKRIYVEFKKLNKSGYYLKLKKVGYGANILFDDSSIKTCTVLEELNPTSDEISINRMSTTILLKDSDYILKIYQVLEEQQQLVVTETVNEIDKDMGTFYLKSKSNPNENTINFETQDLLGLMSNSTYYGGMVNDTVENIIDDIMADFGTTLYTISTDIKDLVVVGHIPVSDHRRAIQLVAFAVNAVVDCSRSNKINLYSLPTTLPGELTNDRYFIGGSQEEEERVTDVQLDLSSYTADVTTKEAYKVTHTSGTYVALFNEPFSGLSISGGTIISSNANYAEFSTTGATVTITGYPYIKSTQTYVVSTPSLPVTTVRRRLKFANTLIWDGAQNVQSIYDKSIDLINRKVKILLENEKAGDFIEVDALYNQTINGYIEKLNIDLTGGFLGEAEIVGTLN